MRENELPISFPYCLQIILTVVIIKRFAGISSQVTINKGPKTYPINFMIWKLSSCNVRQGRQNVYGRGQIVYYQSLRYNAFPPHQTGNTLSTFKTGAFAFP